MGRKSYIPPPLKHLRVLLLLLPNWYKLLLVLTFAGINFRDRLGPKLSFADIEANGAFQKFCGYKLSRSHEILVKFSYFNAIFGEF